MNDVVTLAHGSGGKQTAELIDTVFKAHFSNPEFTADDAALLSVAARICLYNRRIHRVSS